MLHDLVTVWAIESFFCLGHYLQELTYVRRLRVLGLQPRGEVCGGLLLMYMNSWRKDTKRMSPLRAQWQMQTNGHTWNERGSLWRSGNTFWLWAFFFFFSLRVTKHWNTLPRKDAEPPFLRVIQYPSKKCAWQVVLSGLICAMSLDKMTFISPFMPQLFCDSWF